MDGQPPAARHHPRDLHRRARAARPRAQPRLHHDRAPLRVLHHARQPRPAGPLHRDGRRARPGERGRAARVEPGRGDLPPRRRDPLRARRQAVVGDGRQHLRPQPAGPDHHPRQAAAHEPRRQRAAGQPLRRHPRRHPADLGVRPAQPVPLRLPAQRQADRERRGRRPVGGGERRRARRQLRLARGRGHVQRLPVRQPAVRLPAHRPARQRGVDHRRPLVHGRRPAGPVPELVLLRRLHARVHPLPQARREPGICALRPRLRHRGGHPRAARAGARRVAVAAQHLPRRAVPVGRRGRQPGADRGGRRHPHRRAGPPRGGVLVGRLGRPRRHPGHVPLGLRRRRHLDRGRPHAHVHRQRHLRRGPHRQRRRGDGEGHRADHGGEPAAGGHHHRAHGRGPLRRRRHDRVRGHRHRPRGRGPARQRVLVEGDLPPRHPRPPLPRPGRGHQDRAVHDRPGPRQPAQHVVRDRGLCHRQRRAGDDRVGRDLPEHRAVDRVLVVARCRVHRRRPPLHRHLHGRDRGRRAPHAGGGVAAAVRRHALPVRLVVGRGRGRPHDRRPGRRRQLRGDLRRPPAAAGAVVGDRHRRPVRRRLQLRRARRGRFARRLHRGRRRQRRLGHHRRAALRLPAAARVRAGDRPHPQPGPHRPVVEGGGDDQAVGRPARPLRLPGREPRPRGALPVRVLRRPGRAHDHDLPPLAAPDAFRDHRSRRRPRPTG